MAIWLSCLITVTSYLRFWAITVYTKRTQLLSKLPDRKRVNLKLLLTKMLAINVLSRNLMVARLLELRPGNFTFKALLTF